MFEKLSPTFEEIASARARARAEFKWLRNVIVTAIAGPSGAIALASIEAGKFKVPSLLSFVLVSFAAFALHASYEFARNRWQRFVVVPGEIYDEQENRNRTLEADLVSRIRILESQLFEAQAALTTSRANKAFADRLRALDTRGVTELWAQPHPLNGYEAPKWLAKVDAWEADLIAAVQAEGDTGDLHHIQLLGNIYRPTLPRVYIDPTLDQRLVMVDIRRERLRDLIKKYDPSSP